MDKETLERRNYNLLFTGDYSDLTITTKARNWPVHRAIICPQSGFFRAACKGGFKESQTKTISLLEDDPTDIALLLLHLYTNLYTDSPTALSWLRTTFPFPHPPPASLQNQESITRQLLLHPPTSHTTDTKSLLLQNAKMYALGDKYDIPSLKTQACASFTKRIDELGALPPGFVDVYRAVCECTPVGDTGLRGALARACAVHVGQIGGEEEEEGKWVEALEGDGRMVLEVLRRVGRRGSRVRG
ncbi:hypothetical protein G7Y79_00029g063630 [Physcia stellaris]|nr:hypothetical protein G7Y79_00029g063630 [Physcia stellaris]